MSGSKPVLVMTMVVRDEEDILATNLDYHLGQGADLILVTDHGSSDRTSEILERYAAGGHVRWWREDGLEPRLRTWIGQMLKVADEEYAADWVLHSDADEFWIPLAGTLRDVFASVPERYGYLRVPIHRMPTMRNGGTPFYRHMTFRRTSWPRRWPRIAQRPGAGTALPLGSHWIISPTMDCAPQRGTVRINHFQIRSYDQLVHRMKRAQETAEVGEGLNHVTKEMLQLYRAGHLRSVFEAQSYDARRIARALESGSLVFDDSVSRFLDRLAEEPGDPVESQKAQAFLERIWAGASGVSVDPREHRRRVGSRRPHVDAA